MGRQRPSPTTTPHPSLTRQSPEDLPRLFSLCLSSSPYKLVRVRCPAEPSTRRQDDPDLDRCQRARLLGGLACVGTATICKEPWGTAPLTETPVRFGYMRRSNRIGRVDQPMHGGCTLVRSRALDSKALPMRFCLERRAAPRDSPVGRTTHLVCDDLPPIARVCICVAMNPDRHLPPPHGVHLCTGETCEPCRLRCRRCGKRTKHEQTRGSCPIARPPESFLARRMA